MTRRAVPLVTALALSLALRARGAAAQAAVAPTAPTSTSPPLAIDSSRVHPMRGVYRTTLVRDTTSRELGDITQRVVETTYGGAPAWLLVAEGTRGVTATADSVFVARGTLHPLHWSSIAGAARLALELTADSIFGGVSSPLGRQNVSLERTADLLVGSVAPDVVLGALPLDSTARFAASVLLVDPEGAVSVPATIAVEGQERLTVPAGEFDCWIVSIETERATARYWVAKAEPLVVRFEQPLPQLGGATLTRILIQRDTTATTALPAPAPGSPPR